MTELHNFPDQLRQFEVRGQGILAIMGECYKLDFAALKAFFDEEICQQEMDTLKTRATEIGNEAVLLYQEFQTILEDTFDQAWGVSIMLI